MRYLVLLSIVIAVCMITSCQTTLSDQDRITAVEQEASIMIQACFDVINQTAGIEHFGGPLVYNDYLPKTSFEYGQKVLSYKYIGDSEDALLDSFDFYTDTDIQLSTDTEQTAPALDEEYVAYGNFSDNTKEQLLSVFRDFCARKKPCGDTQVHQTKYAFCKEGKVTIEERSVYGLCGLYEIDENNYLVTFDESVGWGFKSPSPDRVALNAELYEKTGQPLSAVQGGQYLLFKRKDSGWVPFCFIDYDLNKVVTEFEQDMESHFEGLVEIEGNLSEEATASLLIEASRINLFDGIIETVQAEGEWVLVSSGTYKKRPMNGVLLSRQDSAWHVTRYYYILNLDINGHIQQYLPLLEKPPVEKVKASAANLRHPEELTEKEIERICELILRIRTIDNRIMRIECKEDGEFEVWTGARSGNCITLKRKGNFWVVVNVSFWVS